jgi:dipeptidyl aminopeptidase/acylaminoacyl peptidase
VKRTILLITIALLLIFGSGYTGWHFRDYIAPVVNKVRTSSPNTIRTKPLEKYTIENLAEVEIEPGIIELENEVTEEDNYSSYVFSFEFAPALTNGELRKTTGTLNLPSANGLFPLVLMLRGYVDQEIYRSGMGTERAAQVFANNGFITIAPDFLGYAGSDVEAGDIFEARFQTYTTVLSLLQTLKHPSFTKATEGKWDGKNVFLWGHSNGGQIALTVLEITGAQYPTALWAPVSKSFPYSVLYYTDESEDKGKLIRRELAKFEELYDVELYSIDNYFERINAPLQIHQGTADNAVPLEWGNELADTLFNLNLDLDYFTYPGADHNMVPSWDTVVSRDVAFFNGQLKL